MEFTNPAPSPTLDDQKQVDLKPAGQPEHARWTLHALFKYRADKKIISLYEVVHLMKG